MANTVNWQNALARLKSGNENFVNKEPSRSTYYRETLVGGQSPYAIILSCADSRVAPELTFDTGLGEIFIIRVAGNIANTSSVASIEYAVQALNVKLIVVLGHESCGAVGAAIQGGDLGPNLNHLVKHIEPAVKATAGKPMSETVKVNAQLNAQDLLKALQESEFVKPETLEDVKIMHAYYNLGSGKVDFLEDTPA